MRRNWPAIVSRCGRRRDTGDRRGAVGLSSHSEGQPLGVFIADKVDLEVAVGRVSRRGERQPGTDQRDRGDLQHCKPAAIVSSSMPISKQFRRCVDHDLADEIAGPLPQPAGPAGLIGVGAHRAFCQVETT